MQCTAKSKRSGVQCGDDAIKGKDKCRMHGGKAQIIHGMYSKYAPKALSEKINEAINDPRLLDLRQELALLKGLTQNLLERVNAEAGQIGLKTTDALITLAEVIGKNIERLDKIEHGQKFVISIETVQKTVIQICEVIKHYIPDPNLRAKIADGLGRVATE